MIVVLDGDFFRLKNTTQYQTRHIKNADQV